VHEVVGRRELDGEPDIWRAAVAATGRPERDLDRGATDPHRGKLDVADRGQPPTGGRHQVPEQRADQIDLDIAQATQVRPLEHADHVGRIEERGEDPIGDRRAWRRQMSVHAHVARERAEVRAGVRDLDPEREIRRGQTIGRSRTHRDEPVA